MADDKYSLSKRRFLLGISIIYLFAFSSLFIQLPGLYGDNGVTPVRLLDFNLPYDAIDFVKDPNIIRLSSIFKLDAYYMLELSTIVGVLLAFLATFLSSFRTLPVYVTLWMLYYSSLKAGQVFLWFQWDIMLVEAGFLAIILSASSRGSDRVGMWLVRWLLFRLMFSAGVVKLTSNCPTWWGLKALHWHYQSQCIPNPMAWYFHRFPGWLHSFSVACTLIIEIPLPLLFFVPLRGVRLFSFYSQLFLQGLIILTGNYNFFNFLTIVLCYSLLTNTDYKRRKSSSGVRARASDLCAWFLIGTVLAISGRYFGFALAPNSTLKSEIVFSKSDFAWFLNHTILLSITMAVVLYCVELVAGLIDAVKSNSSWRKITNVSRIFLVGSLGFLLLFSSFVPFASLDQNALTQLPSELRVIHKHLQPYHLTNSYGLFRRMTGVGGRPELVLEAGPTVDGPWTEYQFRFKPGNLARIPPIVVPHQPRLDWQMWFAALGTAERNPWLYNLVYRLLSREADVLQLLDPRGLPRTPVFVRGVLYTYEFTDNTNDMNWWRRKQQSVYLAPVSLSSPTLLQAVEQTGLVGRRRGRPMDPTPLSSGLVWLRRVIGQPADLSALLLFCAMLAVAKLALKQAAKTAAAAAAS